MKRVLVVMLLLACNEPGQPEAPATPREWLNDQVYVLHDDHRHVTCWVYTAVPAANRGALSCLPDSSLVITLEHP